MRDLILEIRKFVKERNWGKFHSPKNLAIGLAIEVSEILEIFLWLSQRESYNLSKKQINHLKEEIGDVMIYLANLADKFGLNPIECAKEKLKINAKKYTVNIVKGSAKKYTEY